MAGGVVLRRTADALLPAVVWPDDFISLGGHRVPAPSNGEAFYGQGLARRPEPTDSTTPIHYISAALYTGTGNGGFMGYAYEYGGITPEIAGTNPASYSVAPLRQEYGDVYGTPGGTFKRKYWVYVPPDTLADFAVVAGTNPIGNFLWDTATDRLYWSGTDTYLGNGSALEDNNFVFGYSTLNYGTGGSTPHGPWKIASNKFKSNTSGIVGLRPGFVSAMGLGSKRLGFGVGGAYSLVGAGDTSFGPSLTAVAPITGESEETSVAGQPLIGYWPYNSAPGSGRDRMTRPTGYEFIPGTIPGAEFDSWPATQWTWTDRCEAACYVYGDSRAGFVSIGQLARGLATYLNASLAAEQSFESIQIVSEASMAAVIQGAAPSSVQPVVNAFTIPVIDYTVFPYVEQVLSTITSITSVAGLGMNTFNATVTTLLGHGVTTGNGCSIRGTSLPDQYESCWECEVVDATHFKIRNLSYGPGGFPSWTGDTATGGTVRNIWGGNFPWLAPGEPAPKIMGLNFDPVTKIMTCLFGYKFSRMQWYWSVNC